MATRLVNPASFTNYGMSRQRNGFTTVEGAGAIESDGGVPAGAGMLGILAEDLARTWTMYNGDAIAGNELLDSTDAATPPITKQFFTQIALDRPQFGSATAYAGTANFTEMPDTGTGQITGAINQQHVLVFKTTDASLPKSGAVSRGLDQNYRLRFEFDLRPRLYWYPPTDKGDREFPDELYQLNLRMKAAGYPEYKAGATIKESLYRPSSYDVGYTLDATLGASGFTAAGSANTAGWETTQGIPNPCYGWLKVSAGCASQILPNGTVTKPQLNSDGLITLENGSTLDTTITRMPGEMEDLHFEDVTITADPSNTGPYFTFANHTNTQTYGSTQQHFFPIFLDQTMANQYSATQSGGTAQNITNVSQTNPTKITIANHGYVNRQPIAIAGVGGMSELADGIYYVNVIDLNDFEIYTNSSLGDPVDSTNYTAYTSGGTVTGGVGTSTLHTFTQFPSATFYMPTNGSTTSSSTAPAASLGFTKYINNRSIRFRNKRKGCGWFKRFPKTNSNLSGAYPFSYRLTMTERGILFYLHDDAAADQADDYAWFNIQRTVNNESGLPRIDESSKFPVHAMYSCSRETTYGSDLGVYYSTSAANLQTAETAVDTVFDSLGNTYNLSTIANDKTFYIVSPHDREDYLADEFSAKNIWRFVVREFDILKPQDVHKFATRHQIDSNAIINPLEQLAITDENRFVITFPTGLTTQRFMYPKEEMDLICFSSAEVVAESSNIPMTTYKYDGTNTDKRRYQGMRSTAAYGNGMRIMVLVNSQYIFNSDVMLDTNDAVGTAG